MANTESDAQYSTTRQSETIINVRDDTANKSSLDGGEDDAIMVPEAATVSAMLLGFSRYTTAHGLERLVAQRSLIGRITWLMFLVGIYCGLIYHMYVLISRFTSKPLLTRTSTSLPFEFPDVYFCPSRVLSMSKIVETYDHEEMKMLQGLYYMLCGEQCQIDLSKFDIMNESVNKPARLSRAMLALSDTLTVTERTLMHLRRMNYTRSKNLTECRYTESGEEYSGNVNVVPVYSNTLSMSISEKPTDYIQHKTCMSWNDAARRLRSSGVSEAVTAANRILALGFTDSENRCRHPSGLPLTKLHEFAMHPILETVGCFNRTTDAGFNISYFANFPYVYRPGLSVETCAHCCYSMNFTYAALHVDTCYCDNSYVSRLKVKDQMCDFRCYGNYSQLCGGKSAMNVLKVRNPEWKPLSIPYGSVMSNYLQGPYCFYLDGGQTLSAYYCDITFCPASPEYDCVIGVTDESANCRQLSAYTGYQNVTKSGRECLAWRTVPELLANYSITIFTGEYAYLDLWRYSLSTHSSQLHIQTPDYAHSNFSNMCRAAQVVIGWQNRNVSILQLVLRSFMPGCFYLDMEYGVISFETCNVELCYEANPSVTGAITDTIGRALLTQQFSGGLTVGLTDCKFGSRRCTRNDFVNIEHPEFGVCHRFMKQKFVNAMKSSAEVAEAELQIKYFTDSSDSFGRRFENTSKLQSAVHSGLSVPEAESAMRVFAVPSGAYPWPEHGIDVHPAQESRLLLRYEKSNRISRADWPCSKDQVPMTYIVNLWHPSDLRETNLTSQLTDAVLNASAWHEKIERLRNLLIAHGAMRDRNSSTIEYQSATGHDCVNAYMVRKFIENCDCLPSFLPIPTQLAQSKRLCFNQTDPDTLYKAERCYNQQVDNLEVYRMAARQECQPPCETRSYSIREVSHPWPSVKRERALSFLADLAGMHGYPNDVRSSRGTVSLYYAYLRALELSRVPVSSRNLSDVVDFAYEIDIVQDRLAMVTVQAVQPFGDEILEEEAYPVKNVLADMGGALGLWCGVSVLTICEVLELCSFLALRLRLSSEDQRPPASTVSGSSISFMIPASPGQDLQIQPPGDYKEGSAL